MWTMTFKKSLIIKGKVYTIGTGRLLILKSGKSMKNTIFVVAIMIIFTSCNQKNNNMERYDMEQHKVLGEKSTQIIYKKRGDTIIYMSGFDNGGFYQEFPPLHLILLFGKISIPMAY